MKNICQLWIYFFTSSLENLKLYSDTYFLCYCGQTSLNCDDSGFQAFAFFFEHKEIPSCGLLVAPLWLPFVTWHSCFWSMWRSFKLNYLFHHEKQSVTPVFPSLVSSLALYILVPKGQAICLISRTLHIISLLSFVLFSKDVYWHTWFFCSLSPVVSTKCTYHPDISLSDSERNANLGGLWGITASSAPFQLAACFSPVSTICHYLVFLCIFVFASWSLSCCCSFSTDYPSLSSLI